MSSYQPPPPPPPTVVPGSSNIGGFGGSATPPPASTSGTGESKSIFIMIIVLSITLIVSISLCFLIRFLSRRCAGRAPPDEESGSNGGRNCGFASRRVQPVDNGLPIVTFESLNGGGGEKSKAVSGDCAICLSKFQRKDQLRLLPICCHAFHAECVDVWLESNQSCPLCRSAIFASEAEILRKVRASPSTSTNLVEFGSFTPTRSDPVSALTMHRSISIGSFDHVIEEQIRTALRPGLLVRAQSEDKIDNPNHLLPDLGWLREHMQRLSSRTASFRSSGRYFTGSSRRTEISLPGGGYWDTEASRAGEEISEMFRWFSGI